MRSRVLSLFTLITAFFVLGGNAFAAGPAVEGPTPWEINFQPAASPVMERIESFHDFLMWIITIIVLLVLGLLLVAAYRFHESRHPVPSKRSHNTILEIVWTAAPVLVLVIIAVPSFKLLYYKNTVPPAALTVKVTGHQWYWSYSYPDDGNFGFDSLLIPDDQIDKAKGQERLLSADNPMVVPVGEVVRVQVTSGDVVHSWAMPSMGIKIDAIPGRLNEVWLEADKPGIYYGQCSRLCGVNHAYMPIMIEARPKAEFQAWLKDAKQKFAQVDRPGRVRVASVPPADVAR
jgi:cytochrome c oxidase subunit 2